MIIRDFRDLDFEQVVSCYQQGFPEGHNRYSLARLVKWFEGEGQGQGTILVADDAGQVVGVVVGIATHWRAWFTGLTVLPEPGYRLSMLSVRLLAALGGRMLKLGYREAYATTARRNVKRLADLLGAQLMAVEADFFFDGSPRWLYRIHLESYRRLLG